MYELYLHYCGFWFILLSLLLYLSVNRMMIKCTVYTTFESLTCGQYWGDIHGRGCFKLSYICRQIIFKMKSSRKLAKSQDIHVKS